MSDIGVVLKGYPVGDGTLGSGGMEPVGMSDDPVCHESAVGAACDTEMFRIDHRVPFQDFIREIHQVLIVHSSVDSVDISKICAPPVRSSRIAEEHEISAVCPHLHLMIVDV